MNHVTKSCVFFIMLLSIMAQAYTITFSLLERKPQTADTVTYRIAINLNPDEYLYADTISVSTNHPQTHLERWHIEASPIERYDQQFNSTKKVYAQPTTLHAEIRLQTDSPSASLIINHLTNQLPSPQFAFIALNNQPTVKPTPTNTSSPKTACPETIPAPCSAKQERTTTLSTWAQHVFSLTSAWWLRLLLALLLGMLMSLTPCVYPMIPITIGILHAHKAASWRSHVALAISYMVGVASMFAILGLSAAVTGALFGNLSGKPIVVLIIISLLGYFALSLFGLYQLKLPSFLTKPHAQRPTGSMISAFLFGFASGAIASPCLSPGLAFLLSIVATLHSTLYGFALLFMFGIGMSIPLIAIAASSSALALMPRAGAWMVEIQKIFGVLLIALCFYYLSSIVSLITLLVLIGTALVILGFYYLLTSKQLSSSLVIIYRIIGISAFISAAFLYYKAIEYTHSPPTALCPIAWQPSYATALAHAQKTHQLLFIDFGAPYCSICKAIDRCLFHDALIATILNQMTCVQVDASQTATFEPLGKQFGIIGVPTILIINPNTQQVMRRWGAELYTSTHNEFAKQLNELLAHSSLG